MTTERTNEDRAESAMRALRYYSQKAHGGEDYQDYHISDLLGDFHHLADSMGENWDALNAMADTHYDAETGGDNPCPIPGHSDHQAGEGY
jgi:hypothetical protein